MRGAVAQRRRTGAGDTSGGSANDNLVGNAGSDSASGGLGTDGCNAEIETSCES